MECEACSVVKADRRRFAKENEELNERIRELEGHVPVTHEKLMEQDGSVASPIVTLQAERDRYRAALSAIASMPVSMPYGSDVVMVARTALDA